MDVTVPNQLVIEAYVVWRQYKEHVMVVGPMDESKRVMTALHAANFGGAAVELISVCGTCHRQGRDGRKSISIDGRCYAWKQDRHGVWECPTCWFIRDTEERRDKWWTVGDPQPKEHAESAHADAGLEPSLVPSPATNDGYWSYIGAEAIARDDAGDPKTTPYVIDGSVKPPPLLSDSIEASLRKGVPIGSLWGAWLDRLGENIRENEARRTAAIFRRESRPDELGPTRLQ